MNLLALTARLPYPPDRGDRLRAYHFLRTLSREHDITLLSFIADESERQHIPTLQTFCRAVHVVRLPAWRSALNVGGNLWRPLPLQTLYYRSAHMQALVRRVLSEKRYAIAYVHLFRMAQYLTEGNTLPYRIVDLTDVISKEITRSLPYRSTLSRWLYAVERPRIARYEAHIAQRFEEAWLISPADRDELAQRAPHANLQVVTNGVDTQKLHPTGKRPRPNSLLFVGHLRVFHNMDAVRQLAREILPRVQREIPSASLTLVGADPHPEIQALENLPGVSVPGFVPDLNAALNQHAVFVAPLRFAAGIQNKVLEAMAAGRPVVTTSLVNEGLGAQPGTHLLLADNPQESARQIVRLLRHPALAEELGRAARAFVQARFSWEGALRRVNAITKMLD